MALPSEMPDYGRRARYVPDRQAVRFAADAFSSRRAILSNVAVSRRDGGQHLRRIEAQVVGRADPAHSPSAATVLADPLIAVTATGTIVVPRLGSPAAGQNDALGRTGQQYAGRAAGSRAALDRAITLLERAHGDG